MSESRGVMRIAPVVCAVFGLLPAACGGPASEGEPAGADEGITPSKGTEGAEARVSASELEQLRALGYLDYSEEPQDDRAGVVSPSSSRPAAGHSLYTDRAGARAILIDADGRELRSWHDAQAAFFGRAILLEPDGDLVAIGGDANANEHERLFLARYRWDGTLLWKRNLAAHHDVEPTPEGGLHFLMHGLRELEIDGVPVLDDFLTRARGSDGEVESRISVYEALLAAPEVMSLVPAGTQPSDGKPWVDLLHANSLATMPHPALVGRTPLHVPGYVLVCLRHQDAVVVIDPKARRAVWAWGPGELSGPHDATWLENGNLLIFDNGLDRGWSRVVELDPTRREIVWEYAAKPPKSFFTRSRGSSQRLANGNTLIASSGQGRGFEVTRDGRLVWDFFNPRRNARGQRATISRIRRYRRGWIDTLPDR